MSKPALLVITSSDVPAWVGHLVTLLSNEWHIQLRDTSDGYMRQLIDERIALVYVDGTREDWRTWTTVPASSSATRRIPVFVVHDAITSEQARLSGAEGAIAPEHLKQEARAFTRNHARLIAPEQQEALDCDCQKPLPDLAQKGIAKFNAGEYYAQHDLLEALWVQTASPVRDLYRAILQVGVAYYQIERGNYRGALKMLERSVQWLLILPDVCQGVDVAQLRADSFAVRDELERLGAERLHEFDKALIKSVHYHPDEQMS